MDHPTPGTFFLFLFTHPLIAALPTTPWYTVKVNISECKRCQVRLTGKLLAFSKRGPEWVVQREAGSVNSKKNVDTRNMAQRLQDKMTICYRTYFVSYLSHSLQLCVGCAQLFREKDDVNSIFWNTENSLTLSRNSVGLAGCLGWPVG